MLSNGKLSSPKNYLKSEDGFTFIEILISLVLLSILGIVLFSGLFNAQGLIGKISRTASFSVKILQLDDFVIKAAQSVKIPFWVKEIEIEDEDDRLAIPYLNGDSEDFLIFQRQDNLILVGYQKSGQFSSFGPFAGIDFKPLENENRQSWGVQLTIKCGSNAYDEVVISAHFGSIPFSISGME